MNSEAVHWLRIGTYFLLDQLLTEKSGTNHVSFLKYQCSSSPGKNARDPAQCPAWSRFIKMSLPFSLIPSQVGTVPIQNLHYQDPKATLPNIFLKVKLLGPSQVQVLVTCHDVWLYLQITHRKHFPLHFLPLFFIHLFLIISHL